MLRRFFRLGRTSFCGERLQRLNIQRLLGHHLFQPPVFLFLLMQFLHVADFQAGVFRPPLIIEGGIRDAVPPAQALNTLAGLGFLQHDDNLTIGMTFSGHGPSPFGKSPHDLTS